MLQVPVVNFAMSRCCKSSGTFKKMLKQKRKEQTKDYDKQEKRLKEMKSSGKSTKQAVSGTPT